MLTNLLLIILVIPLLNSLILAFSDSSLAKFSNKILPILSAVILIGIYQKFEDEALYLNIIPIFNNISFGFLLDFTAFKFLALLTFLWIIFSFYSEKFFELTGFSQSKIFQTLFSLNIAGLTFLIISKNLLTLLVFYHFAILVSLFFALKFLYEDQEYPSPFFVILFYLKALFIFLAVILTYKMLGSLEFSNDAVQKNIGLKFQLGLLTVYFCALLLFLILPLYLLYRRNFNGEPFAIYSFLMLPHAFAALFILTRVLEFIFGFAAFGDLADKIGFKIIEIAFLAILIIPAVLLIFSKTLKSSFICLFFHRFIFALFGVLFFAKFNISSINLPIYALALEFTLLFLLFSNLNIYFSQSEGKKFEGLFYQMPVTGALLLFTFASMIGFAPTIGMSEKFLILQNGSWIAVCILVLSGFSLLFFFFKSFRFIFLRSLEELPKNDQKLAKDVDFDSRLILTPLLTAIAAFSIFIINFFYHP